MNTLYVKFKIHTYNFLNRQGRYNSIAPIGVKSQINRSALALAWTFIKVLYCFSFGNMYVNTLKIHIREILTSM